MSTQSVKLAEIKPDTTAQTCNDVVLVDLFVNIEFCNFYLQVANADIYVFYLISINFGGSH